MNINFVNELQWRGLLHDQIPGTESALMAGPVTGYAGFDPTSTSLTIGNLVAIMLLVHFQKAGHKPIALVGGATGMIGDPSGKSEERNLLSEDALRHNQECIRRQLEKFLDFTPGPCQAEMVNNYDWIHQFTFLDFLRDVGKHLTVNYMIAKDSVKKRLETGLSFTEFTYQLIQGYDFYWLYKNKGCRLQMGGSDQWGNITAGCEFIRRKAEGEAFALTTPLLMRADGVKFGKSEGGDNIWLSADRTSPYKFYQFWLNTTDVDASRFIRIFTTLDQDVILSLEKDHAAAPHLRTLQKMLAKEVTIRVHSESAYQSSADASEILFGNGTTSMLARMSEQDLLSVFDGVARFSIPRDKLSAGVKLIDLLAVETPVFPSKGEARKMILGGGVSINKEKMPDPDSVVTAEKMLNGRYLVIQKGKKNYQLVIAG